MGLTSGIGTTGLVALVLSYLNGGDMELPVVFTEQTELFNESATCEPWSGSAVYIPTDCSSFGLTRFTSSQAAAAIELAVTCGIKQSRHDCLLSGEIGLGLPAAFLYDEADGYRMLLAPRISAHQNASKRLVKLSEYPRYFTFYNELDASFLVGGTRVHRTETLRGQDAYCVQALKASVADACWSEIDT